MSMSTGRLIHVVENTDGTVPVYAAHFIRGGKPVFVHDIDEAAQFGCRRLALNWKSELCLSANWQAREHAVD